jgi:hypothetical protein
MSMATRSESLALSEAICGHLRLGYRCDKSNAPTSIIVTEFAPIDTWGVCRPPIPVNPSLLQPPGLCYYSDHNPQEIQEEIRCWAAKWPLSAQGTSVIPMVPSYWHEITGCSFLKISYQPTTGHMNAMKVGGSTQAVRSTRGGCGPGISSGHTSAFCERHHSKVCLPPFLISVLNENPMDRSTVCPTSDGDNPAGFEFRATNTGEALQRDLRSLVSRWRRKFVPTFKRVTPSLTLYSTKVQVAKFLS